ncbi:lipase family protein [Paenibacillus kobensis]|uniref:lipase family protein n=1 Tax=Paenibacillus kobensis TaxID=59841 RepID=UPI001FE802DE|nr:lipase family protein [Paenibacillus kobensis]
MEPLIAWGKFVGVAYEMYKIDHRSPGTPADFPVGWERVANLTMTPRLESIKEKEFGGYIAQSLSDASLQAVVIRGTESSLDWLMDFEFKLETFHEVPNSGKTEAGFTNLYRSMTVEYADPSRPSELLSETLDHLPAGTKLVVTGHSLGSSLATIHAFLAGSKNFDVELITFASPRVGDSAFVEAFERMNIANTRVFNKPDVVPTVPIELFGYRHLEPGIEINSGLYPIKHSVSCYHALSTYLYVMGDTQANIDKCRAGASS